MPPKLVNLTELNLKLKNLVAKKETYFNTLQRLYDFSRNLDDEHNLDNFKIELHTVDDNLSSFKEMIEQINYVNLEIDPEYILNYQPLQAINTMYCHIMQAAKSLGNSQESHSRQLVEQSAVAKLQKIDIPEFSGDPKRWPIFFESFKSLVHCSNLDNTSKMHYLLSALKGKALDVCAGIMPTGANYNILWETLVSKYEDKRLLADTYFNQLMDFKTAQNESFTYFNNFLEKFDTSVKALKQLDIADLADFLIASIALSKLDSQTRKLFEISNKKSDIPTYAEIIDFINIQRKALNTLSKTCYGNYSKFNNTNKQKPITQTFTASNSSYKKFNKISADGCPICKQNHKIFHCSDFLKLSPQDRYNIVKEKKLCINCLSCMHKIAECKSTNVCNTCHLRHHSFLHFCKSSNTDQNTLPSTSQSQINQINNSIVEQSTTQNFCSATKNSDFSQNSYTTLLSTAVVNIMSPSGEYKLARFLIDTGSQSHFITTRCCQKLQLPFKKYQSLVHGIGGSQAVLGHVQLVINSRFDTDIQYQLQALVVDRITDRIPVQNVDIKTLNYLKHLQLADEQFYKPSHIDGIIGANLFLHILGSSKVIGPPNLPIAVQTTLGYIVMGSIPTASAIEIENPQTFCSISEPSLDKVMQKFWELEEILESPVLSKDDSECEHIFSSTTFRNLDGKYVVALPFREYPPTLGNSFDVALRRFYSLENKFKKSSGFRKKYCDIISDYLEQGHLKFVSVVSNSKIDNTSYYIPHFAVFKDSVSTPIRIVFDASAKTSNLRSLNDVLYSGPKLQTNIFKILLNFRLFEFAMIADIRQMYRNILVCAEHQNYQRIIWRFSPEEELAIYELTTVVFGITSSSFVALRTVKQLANDEFRSFPLASDIVTTNIYIDDLVLSTSTTTKAIELYHQLVGLFKAGGFALIKWVTDCQDLLEEIPADMRLSKNVEFIDSENNSSLKVLGLQWDPKNNTFSFIVNVPNKICTKRNILSTLARIWDPLGFLSPVTFFAKILIKELWMSKIDWDEEPPLKVKKLWLEFYNEVVFLSQFRVPRYIGFFKNCSAELIGFADSSLLGYGAVVFIKILKPNGEVKVNLLCAKSKVAPVKICTITRLELCSAVLLSKLIKSVLDTYASQIKIDNIYALSDSTVVLHWISSSPHKWKTFVANRVAKIQNYVPNAKWYHVDSKNNIADCVSRGLTPTHFLNNSKWVSGPSWLTLETELWPIQQIAKNNIDIPEEKINLTFPVAVVENSELRNLMLRMSSWSKLCRITVYVLRFLKMLPINKTITASDLEKAELVLIRIVQKIYFVEDFQLLQNNKISTKSLRYLYPFLKNDCIRVGGRLEHAKISYDKKHPLLLPKKDHLVDILIDHFHRLYLHTGPHLLLSILRQRYWILSARNIVRHRIKKCNYCFKFKPQAVFPQMADLPSPRVTQAKPFLNCGVDYAGPFYITLSRRRGVKSQKAYICLFVCLTTKAIHLELASDMSTATFLNCFKRFLSRRGPVACIYSDCGTNFIGAKAELERIYNLIQSNDYVTSLGSELALHGVEWKFNPPSAPHFGGIWESNIKSTKTHLYKVIGNQILTYEEFTTVLVQIEALLNSRPLCWLSSDPSDPVALTPAHFLTLSPLRSLPATEFCDKKQSILSRKELLDHLVQSFWNRWRVEYLSSLQTRQKWNTSTCPVVEGTLVLIRQENTPPLQWPLGVIEKAFKGKDNIIRVALVRTANSVYKRPIVKLCPLPTQ